MPQEASRLQAEGGPDRKATFGSGSQTTSRGHPLRAARVPGEGRGCSGERLDREPDAKALGMESKKRSMAARERDEFLRVAWRVLVAEEVDAERLVFADEMGANVSLSPQYAWSRKGKRAFGSAPRNWGKNLTLLASITEEGVGPCLAVEGSTTREVFEAYLEGVLAPTLKPGQVVVMDNLSAHKGGRVKEIVEGRDCELVYLPPYSPDFNPIEQAFSKLKGLLRQAEARTRETLIEAMGRALSALTDRDARGFFAHCGYREVVQPL